MHAQFAMLARAHAAEDASWKARRRRL